MRDLLFLIKIGIAYTLLMISKQDSANRHGTIKKWLDKYGDSLYRYAFLRTRSRESAEDIVQETLIGALRAVELPDGRATEKTWLFGILKHKIADYGRTRQRSPLDQSLQNEDESDIETQIFQADGRWREPTSTWGDPLKHVESQTFLQSLKGCLETLPTAQSEMFMLREIEEMSLEDAAQIAGVSAANVYVLLHRARLALRQCLRHVGYGEENP